MTIRPSFTRARAGLLGAAALGLFLTLSGCGGGGGGSNSRTAVIKPSTTPVGRGTGSSCASSYTPNYAPSVTLLHWTHFPLKVYFKRDSNYSAARQSLATQGFDEWVQATNGGATYRVVTSASGADITVNFYTFTGGPGDTLGVTYVHYYDDDNTIDSAEISLGFTGNNGNDILTAAHEYGHAIGIYGHSPSNQDLMYFEGNDAKCGCITPADLDTVLAAYCGNFPQNANARVTPHTGELKTVVIR